MMCVCRINKYHLIFCIHFNLHTQLNCDYFTGSSLNQDRIIAIASSISLFIITSILFSVFGYLCGVYHQKQQQNSPSSVNKPTPGPAYEDVLPKDYEHKLERQSNIAYASVHK